MAKIKAFGDRVLATMAQKPSGYKKSKSGLLIADKDMEASGIKPRWFKIVSVGEKIDWLSDGDYVLVAHGRWSNGVDIDNEKVYLLDNNEILMLSSGKPEELEIETN